jgi:hypothetical protein
MLQWVVLMFCIFGFYYYSLKVCLIIVFCLHNNIYFFIKKSLNTKCVFRFSLQLLSETFLIAGRNERDMFKNVYWSSCQIYIGLHVKCILVFMSNAYWSSCQMYIGLHVKYQLLRSKTFSGRQPRLTVCPKTFLLNSVAARTSRLTSVILVQF